MGTLYLKTTGARTNNVEGLLSYIQDIPAKATIRREYVQCSNVDCKKCHADPHDFNQDENGEKLQPGYGPYLYAYWREGKKVKKKYIGKSLEDYKFRQIAKAVELTPTRLMKSKFLKEEASKGDPSAQKYLEKLKQGKVSIDRAYKVLISSQREARLFRMIEIADHKQIRYEDENQLFKTIASIMESHGFDPMYVEEWDRYLKSDLGNMVTEVDSI